MTIRRQPEDFIVEERANPAFLASLLPRGSPARPHAVYSLTKQSLTTPDAAQHLARALRCRAGAPSYAGLKDKHARTTQMVSVHATGPVPDFAEGPGWFARRIGWTDEPIDSETIDGNRFSIIVRDLSSPASAEMARRAALLRGPVPLPGTPADDDPRDRLLIVNYFGDQRFGSARHGQGFAARRLIESDFDGALRLAIGTPARKDSGSRRTFTRACAAHWGRWKELLAKLPRSPERAPIELLAAGADSREAFAALPRFTQLMCVEAFQSHLWNATARNLAGAIAADGGHEPLTADDDFGLMVFPDTRDAVPPWRDLVLPLLAPKTTLEEPWADAASRTLADEGIKQSMLRVPGLRKPFFGEAPRPLFARAERFVLGMEASDELSPNSIRLKRAVSFDLPRGAYATVVLRALGQ